MLPQILPVTLEALALILLRLMALSSMLRASTHMTSEVVTLCVTA